ncbi:Branched-chain-amino-acid aminotransferase [Durusdinium trenchii]|uniref:Branched-chain-amino-acid aminotransferase n=1 Tax=Durusdinium trenchii TaxID=1381693 RepID=A0ABP0JPM3_9DINO
MLQSLATFTAGVFTGQSLNACHANLPRCSLQEEEGCRLFLHVHGARVPTSEPGIWSQRPQLVVRLADCEKHTEPAVFAPKAGEAHCNWHFGDTLTFVLRARDLMGAGLHVHLQGKRDFRFGLFQVDLSQSSDLGDGLLDLRQLLHRCQASNDARWESPIVEIPLLHFRAATAQEAAPSVFVQVSLNGDPNALLKQVEMAEKPVVERMEASGTEPESEEPPEADYRTCDLFQDGRLS